MRLRGGRAPAAGAAPLPAAVAVDLDVKDVPLRAAVEQVAKRTPPADRLHTVVDESVPEDLRVTAQSRKAPLGWVVEISVGQAGLVHGVRDEPDLPLRADLEGEVRERLMDSVPMQN